MNVTLKSLLTLTFALATLSVTPSEGQGHICDLNSRPHSQGLCGAKLSRAHSNLCFLLSRAYPNHFPGKRSVDSGISNFRRKRFADDSFLLERIYSLPLSALVDLDISDDEWDFSPENDNFQFLHFLRQLKERPSTSVPQGQAELSDVSQQKSMAPQRVDQMEEKKRRRRKRSAAYSSMVCECCYNACTPRHLATYC